MKIFLIVMGVVIVNALVGAFVWGWIDDDDQRLFKWFRECPGGPLGTFVVLSAWPVALWFWWRLKR